MKVSAKKFAAKKGPVMATKLWGHRGHHGSSYGHGNGYSYGNGGYSNGGSCGSCGGY